MYRATSYYSISKLSRQCRLSCIETVVMKQLCTEDQATPKGGCGSWQTTGSLNRLRRHSQQLKQAWGKCNCMIGQVHQPVTDKAQCQNEKNLVTDIKMAQSIKKQFLFLAIFGNALVNSFTVPCIISQLYLYSNRYGVVVLMGLIFAAIICYIHGFVTYN